MERQNTASVEVLSRAVRVLEVLADAPRGAPLHQLSRETGLAKSSAHRLLSHWERLGYVMRTGSGAYQLGLGALELARKVHKRNRLVELSHTLLRRLQSETGESVYLAIYRNGRVVLVDAVESPHPLRVVVDLGEQCYLHASAQGRVVAGWLPPERLAELLRESGMPRMTAKTQVDPRLVERRIAEERETGYAINWEETVEGSVCLAAPLFAGEEGSVLGSIGISIPTPRASEPHVHGCLQLLLRATQELTSALAAITPEPDARGRSDLSSVAALRAREMQPLDR